MTRPRVGLLQARALGEDPLRSVRRLLPVLPEVSVEAVPIRLDQVRDPRLWIGRRVREADGWRVEAADLGADAWSGKTRMRLHALAAQVAILARRERLEALHLWGLSGPDGIPAVAAVAAAEADLPLVVSLLDGDADLHLSGDLAGLRMALRGACLGTVPCRADAARVTALLQPSCPVRVVPPHLDAPLLDVAVAPPGPGPVVAGYGEHGRDSGLDLLLAWFGGLPADRPERLLLVGSSNPAESHAFSPRVDRHPRATRILRTGHAEPARALALLRGCALAALPLATGRQALRALEALAAGARVLAAPAGAVADLGEVLGRDDLSGPGGPLVAERTAEAWSRALDEALQGALPGPALGEAVREAYGPARARERWGDLYREVLSCS